MRMRSRLDPLARLLQARGLFYYRRARVVRCDALDIDSGDPRNGVEVQEASEEDFHRLAAMLNERAAEWPGRRAKGMVCLVARSGPVPLGYLWITRSPEVMTEVDHVIDVSRDAAGAYMFDGYVLPAHRRKGVLRTLLGSSKRWAAQCGVSRLYSAFARENKVSEHALLTAGFVTVVGDVGILRLLGREWKWVRLPHGGSIFDILGAD